MPSAGSLRVLPVGGIIDDTRNSGRTRGRIVTPISCFYAASDERVYVPSAGSLGVAPVDCTIDDTRNSGRTLGVVVTPFSCFYAVMVRK